MQLIHQPAGGAAIGHTRLHDRRRAAAAPCRAIKQCASKPATQPEEAQDGLAHAAHHSTARAVWYQDALQPGSLQHAGSHASSHASSSFAGSAQLQARELTQRIKACLSWQQLQALLQDNAHHMNAIHVSALVTQLAKTQLPSAVARVAAAGALHRAGVSTSQKGSVSHSAASRAERAAFDRFLGQLSHIVLLRCESLDARGLANILWSVARLGFRPSPDLLNRLLFMAYVKAEQLNAQELANLGWALATMQVKPSAAWMQRYVLQVRARLHTFKPQELAIVAWALSRLSLPPAAMGPAAAVAQGRHVGGSAGDANVARAGPWAAPREGLYASRGNATAAVPALKAPSDSDGAEEEQQPLLTALCHTGLQLLGSFRSRELLILLSALYRLFEVSGCEAALQPWDCVWRSLGQSFEIAIPAGPARSPQMSAAAQRWWSCPEAARLLHAACGHLMRQGGVLSPQDACTWLYLLARLQYSPAVPQAQLALGGQGQLGRQQGQQQGQCRVQKQSPGGAAASPVGAAAASRQLSSEVASAQVGQGEVVARWGDNGVANSIVPFSRRVPSTVRQGTAGLPGLSGSASLGLSRGGGQGTGHNGTASCGDARVDAGNSASSSVAITAEGAVATLAQKAVAGTRGSAEPSAQEPAHRSCRQAFYAALLTRRCPPIARHSPRTLCGTAWAVARLRLSPPRGWTRQVAEHAAACMAAMNAADLCTLGWALHALGHRPCTAWLRQYMRCTLDRLLACTAAELSCLARVVGAWAERRNGPASGPGVDAHREGGVESVANHGHEESVGRELGDWARLLCIAAGPKLRRMGGMEAAVMLQGVARVSTGTTAGAAGPRPAQRHHMAEKLSSGYHGLLPAGFMTQALEVVLRPCNAGSSHARLVSLAVASLAVEDLRHCLASAAQSALTGPHSGLQAQPANTLAGVVPAAPLPQQLQRLHEALAAEAAHMPPGLVLALLHTWADSSRAARGAAAELVPCAGGEHAHAPDAQPELTTPSHCLPLGAPPAPGQPAVAPSSTSQALLAPPSRPRWPASAARSSPGLPAPSLAAAYAATWQGRPSAALVGRMLQRLYACREALTAPQLAHSLTCLARLRFRPPDAVLGGLLLQLVRRLAGRSGNGSSSNPGPNSGSSSSSNSSRGSSKASSGASGSSAPGTPLARGVALRMVLAAARALTLLGYTPPPGLGSRLSACLARCLRRRPSRLSKQSTRARSGGLRQRGTVPGASRTNSHMASDGFGASKAPQSRKARSLHGVVSMPGPSPSPTSLSLDPSRSSAASSTSQALSPSPLTPATAAALTRALCRLGDRPQGPLRTLLVATLLRRPADTPTPVLLDLLYALVVQARALLFPRGWRRVLGHALLPRLHQLTGGQLRMLARCMWADRFRYGVRAEVRSALLGRAMELWRQRQQRHGSAAAGVPVVWEAAVSALGAGAQGGPTSRPTAATAAAAATAVARTEVLVGEGRALTERELRQVLWQLQQLRPVVDQRVALRLQGGRDAAGGLPGVSSCGWRRHKGIKAQSRSGKGSGV